jgi:UDP-N-acetylglucosamine 2-epimerase
VQSNKKISLALVAGSRPEIIKLSGLIEAYHNDETIPVIYTGQHYSYEMRDNFLDELGVSFDYDLGCRTSDTCYLTKKISSCFEAIKPEYVVVYGDTNSTMAAAIAAKQVNSTLIHIEAGLRSFDPSMVEERNRVYIDSISDFLFSPTYLSKVFLQYEGITNGVFVTGNLISDICRKYSKRINCSQPANIAAVESGYLPSYFLLLTLHRPETVDRPELLGRLMNHLSNIGFDVVFPIHPRTRNNLINFNIPIPPNVFIIPPQGYFEFLGLLNRSILVLTDSGGVQEESVILRKPCITLRTSTERQETLLIGANRLFPLGYEKVKLAHTVHQMLETKITANPYGENVTRRTVDILDRIVRGKISLTSQPMIEKIRIAKSVTNRTVTNPG